ncbi:MAG: Membrane protein insertion efficiency factor YidD [uncultured Chthoniobacterales bacterium]|uniref:Putative membrane protein insertion efficiency factor n=1 Tax=uncultured Chthoniobacterales bacterium TaxID=1836801 RepID=A0A6J4HD07_9BACT|nr:MAG: Membrane protein insertion efficiency factor YidD [uncultured Chthoniobacterales bacterium]
MSAAPPAPKRRRTRIRLIAAVVLAAAAIFDWSRAPGEQLSVAVYERAVVSPYRWLVRPFMSAFVRCRYQPTCSQYSLDAVRAHGFPKGFWLTAKRLFRCMPWVPLGTHDPVPAR